MKMMIKLLRSAHYCLYKNSSQTDEQMFPGLSYKKEQLVWMPAPYQPHPAGNLENCIMVAFVLRLSSLEHHNNSGETKLPLFLM